MRVDKLHKIAARYYCGMTHGIPPKKMTLLTERPNLIVEETDYYPAFCKVVEQIEAVRRAGSDLEDRDQGVMANLRRDSNSIPQEINIGMMLLEGKEQYPELFKHPVSRDPDPIPAPTPTLESNTPLPISALYATAHLGLREKFAKGILTKEEPLTERDMRRMLELTEANKTAQIVAFQTDALSRVVQAEIAKRPAGPYIIPLLLNAGLKTGSTETHWMSATITVHPLTRKVSYCLRDNAELNEETKAEYRRRMVLSLPESWSLSGENSLTGETTHTSYQALRTVIEESIPAARRNAVAMSYCAPSVESLRENLYQAQLCSLTLEGSTYLALNNVQRTFFEAASPHRVKTDCLRQYLASSAPVVSATSEALVPLSIGEALSTIKSDTVALTYPAAPDLGLTAPTYELFFAHFQKKTTTLGRKTLPLLTLSPCTEAALDGLNAYCVRQAPLSIDTLTLTLPQRTPALIQKLKWALLNVSNSGVGQVVLTDALEMSESDWSEIKEFVVNTSNITVKVTLPDAFVKSNIQREIDEAVSDHQRLRAAQSLEETAVIAPPTVVAGKRTRVRRDASKQVNRDVEMQVAAATDEQEEVAQAAEVALVRESGGALSAVEGISFADAVGSYQGLISKTELHAYWGSWTNQQSVGEGVRPIAKPPYSLLSKAAVDYLLLNHRMFQEGLHPDQLPAGFVIAVNAAGDGVLHYDKTIHHEVTLAPRVVQAPVKKPVSAGLMRQLLAKLESGNTRDGLVLEIKEALLKDPYDQQSVERFRHHLPALLHFNEGELQAIIHFCKEGATFKADRFDFILLNHRRLHEIYKGDTTVEQPYADKALIGEKAAIITLSKTLSGVDRPATPSWITCIVEVGLRDTVTGWQTTYALSHKQMDGVLQVFAEYGEPGLQKLDKLWRAVDQSVLKEVLSTLYQKADTFTPMISDPKIEQAMKSLQALSQNENAYAWWKALLAQHATAVGLDDLPALVETFLAFKQQVERLGLSFYQPVSFTDVKSMPVALGRMLSIVTHASRIDQAAQWQCLAGVSLKATGAIRAFDRLAFKTLCGFVVPEMRVDLAHYELQGNKLHSGYLPKSAWREISKTRDLEAAQQAFYRFVAHQSDRLSLSFYQRMDQTIREASALTDEQKKSLYALLAAGTTGALNTNPSFVTEGETIAAFSSLVSSLDGLSMSFAIRVPIAASALPGVTAEHSIRDNVLKVFFKLPTQPPLFMLNHLWRISSSMLTRYDLVAVKEEAKRFRYLSQAVISMVNPDYGDALFRGMRFYKDVSYQERPGETSIFFRHLEVARVLDSPQNNWVLLKMSRDPTRMPVLEVWEKLGSQEGVIEYDRKLFHVTQNECKEILNLNKEEFNHDNEKIYEDLKNLLGELPEDIPRRASQLEKNLILEKAKSISSEVPYNYITTHLLPLISHFGLAEGKSIDNVRHAQALRAAYEAIPLRIGSGDVVLGLQTLEKMNTRGTPPVNYERLLAFISDPAWLLPEHSPDHRSIVERHFKNNFSDGFFAPKAAAVSAAIDLSPFKESDRPRVQAILSQATAKQPGIDQKALAKTLSQIIRGLSKSEGSVLLARLEALSALPETNGETFNALILVLQKPNAPGDCLFFLSQADKVTPAVPALVKKTAYYLNTIVPEIKRVRMGEVVSKRETRHLAIDLLLAMEGDEIARPYNNLHEQFMPAFLLNNLMGVEDLDAQKKMVIAFQASYPDFLEGMVSTYKQSLEDRDSFIVNQSRNKKDAKKNQAVILEFDRSLTSTKDLIVEQCGSVLEKATFIPTFFELLKTIHRVAEQYPGDKNTIIAFLQHFLSHPPQREGLDQLTYAWQNLHVLEEALKGVDNADIVRSLCEHFKSQEAPHRPEDLLVFLQSNEYKNASEADRKLSLRILTALLNNGKPCPLEGLQDTIKFLTDLPEQEQEQVRGALEICYRASPYPTLSEFVNWLKELPEGRDLTQYIQDKYLKFDKSPCAREPDNGFHLGEARKKTGLELSENTDHIHGKTYDEATLLRIQREVEEARTLPTSAINAQLQAYRKNPAEVDNEKLLALAAELLYRTKGLPAEKGQAGRSFEINTTQYLAIHAMLTSGLHVTSQIGTGEGKSRIMMLMNVCQYAKGKTVDFVTSDMELATRDYLEYKSLFDALGAPINLIHQHSPVSDYRLDGINFSDAANLSLFRNKARSEGKGEQVIAAPTKRALMLDEADRTYFDSANIRYNYSAMADQALAAMPWVYEAMVAFCDGQDFQNEGLSYYTDKDTFNTLFRDSVRLLPNPEEKLRQLASVSDAQLEAWQDAAVAAFELKLDEDFVIQGSVEISTRSGPKMVSEARLLDASGREDQGSKFSFGVHQCLHARLNRIKAGEAKEKVDSALQAKLKESPNDFYIETEKQIIYSSNSHTLVSDYDESALCAVTGTMGSIQEQEAKKAFAPSASRAAMMNFITVPRHAGLYRDDRPTLVLETDEARDQFLIDEIKVAIANRQPVAIMCEHHRASDALMKKLQGAFPDYANLMRLHAQSGLETERGHIKGRAGRPGVITLSTGMIGRGTDIRLQEENNRGLKMLVSGFIPKKRDLEQYFGRSGRMGNPGDARLVLSKDDARRVVGEDLDEDFEIAVETYIENQQAVMNHETLVDNLLFNTVSAFRLALTNQFFDEAYKKIPPAGQPKALEAWQGFFAATDRAWADRKTVLKAMDYTQLSLTDINKELLSYHTVVGFKWAHLSSTLVQLGGVALSTEIAPLALAPSKAKLLEAPETKPLTIPIVKPKDATDIAYRGKAYVIRGGGRGDLWPIMVALCRFLKQDQIGCLDFICALFSDKKLIQLMETMKPPRIEEPSSSPNDDRLPGGGFQK